MSDILQGFFDQWKPEHESRLKKLTGISAFAFDEQAGPFSLKVSVG
jgi:hypothetical protein